MDEPTKGRSTEMEEEIREVIEEGHTSDEISEVLHQVALTHMVFLIDEDGHTSLVSSMEITEEQAKVSQRVALVVRDPSFMLIIFLFIESLMCRTWEAFTRLKDHIGED